MNHCWFWGLAPLLLAAALVTPGLDGIAFNSDEARSLVDGAGAYPSGPQSLAEIPNHIAPDQALGWPMLLFLWVRVAGWSEVAVRTVPLLAGMLTLAMVYRAGRDLFSARVGLHAALLLSAAVFLHTHMQNARAFTLVTLCATLCCWGYWRIALHPRPPERGAQAALLLGATGLLYTHYYATLLLPVLGLFHLLFVPKTRRWWRPVLLFGLAGLLASIQLPLLLQGLALNAANEFLHGNAMYAPELLARFFLYLSNGMLAPTPAVGVLLLLLLPLTLALLTLRHLRARRRADATWLLVFVCLALLLLFTTANEILRLISHSRLRYLIALWPLVALLAGAGLHQLAGNRPRLVALLMALWLGAGAWLGLTTTFRYELGRFGQSDRHLTWRALRERISTGDLFILEHELYFQPDRMYLPDRTVVSRMDERLADRMPLHAAVPSVWLLYDSSHSLAQQGYIERDGRLERILCERVQQHPAMGRRVLRLERYVRHPSERCPDSPVRLEFNGGIRLIGPRSEGRDGLLRLDAHFHSDDEQLLANYSLAVHIIDPRTGERVAQGDTGVGPGHIAHLRSEIDVSALPAGEYELSVGLYDWRTGELLPARDLETGASGDMHTLQRFRVG